jgi:hypothetical protein
MIDTIFSVIVGVVLLVEVRMILETYRSPSRKGPQDGPQSTIGSGSIGEHGGET